jgi:hypothetical protein
VVINEVFTLPATHQAQYSWIELYNPTGSTVDIGRWTISFTTSRWRDVTTVVLDSNYQFRLLLSFETFPPSFGAYDIPFAQRLLLSTSGVTIRDTFRLEPKSLYTFVNNEARLLDHTEWGPGPTSNRFVVPVSTRIDSLLLDSTYIGQDSVIAVLYQTNFLFQLQPTDQILLKDENGQVVDVVRYGNYVFPGPGADPYPGNVSLGAMPEYESIARYAGGYSTGNTAVDFYITDPVMRPIPHWYSQRYKQ